MAEKLQVAIRDTRGKRNARRLRRDGKIPAVLYGHGQECVSLSVPLEQVQAAVRHGSRLVDLQGAVSETALIRDLQWDTFGLEVLHLDFARVSADERIEVTVSIELRGEAPGVKEGGVLQQPLHEVLVDCLAIAIPDKLQLSINGLKLGDVLHVRDLKVPQGVSVLTDADEILAQCVKPAEETEGEAAAEGAEPELIGRKAEAEEEEEE